jgi:hypothetical protein
MSLGGQFQGPRTLLNRLLPLTNVAACVLFIVLREPVPSAYLVPVDEARRQGGLYVVSGIDGMLACRNLYSWSDWHGGEALGVKVLEVANLPALVLTVIAAAFSGDLFGLGRSLSACHWSWVLASLFLLLASFQWWLIGSLGDRALLRRSRGGGGYKAA